MITKYDIAFENKNTILIVNLDFYYEFADFDYKGYTKNLKKEILKIAKKHNAKKIKIVIDGILISTLLLSSTNIENEYVTTYITDNTIKESFNKIIPDDDLIIIDVSKSEEEIKLKNNTLNNGINSSTKNSTTNKFNVENNKEPFKNNINENITINNEISNKKKEDITTNIDASNKATNKKNTTTNNEIYNTSIDTETSSNENNKEENNIEIKEEMNTNTYVTIYRSNGSIIKLELEEYLIGVVGSEMPASFNIEALKAQAIVARTYALKRISQGKTLTDTVSTQVYKDNNELKNMWGNEFSKYYNKVKNAVISTKGIVLMYNNTFIDAVYHSTSNGKTEDAIYVWGNDIPYLKSVDSKTDLNASSYKREIYFTYGKISNILNTTITKDTDIYLERNTSGRVSNVKINDIEIKGTTFRSLLSLRSTDFTIELKEDNVLITTYGYGHGVGMSQYGANGMANSLYTYEQILKHYYQNVSLKSI